MKRIALAALTAAIASPVTAQTRQTDTNSYAYMRGPCDRMASDNDTRELYMQGKCFGMILAVVMSNLEICEPNGWSGLQAHLIIKQYADKMPAEWSVPYPIMARAALMSVWKCADTTAPTPTPQARGRTW